jgi:hypothetical protein
MRRDLPVALVGIAGRERDHREFGMVAIAEFGAGRGAVAARAQQLEAHVVQAGGVAAGVAARAVGAQQQGTVLVAHVALRLDHAGTGIEAQGLAGDALVAALDHGRALQPVDPRFRRTLHVDAERVEVGRRQVAVDVGGQARRVELEQRVDATQRPVGAVGGDGDRGGHEGDQGYR